MQTLSLSQNRKNCTPDLPTSERQSKVKNTENRENHSNAWHILLPAFLKDFSLFWLVIVVSAINNTHATNTYRLRQFHSKRMGIHDVWVAPAKSVHVYIHMFVTVNESAPSSKSQEKLLLLQTMSKRIELSSHGQQGYPFYFANY